MRISVDVKESANQISREIMNLVLKQMQASWQKATDNITRNLPDVVIDAIKGQPEYASIINGTLRSEFGLTNSATKVNDIISIWAKDIVVEDNPPKLVGSQVRAFYSFSMIKSDYSDVLSSPSAKQLIEGGNLPWLSWLLLQGGEILVPRYDVKFGPNPSSRTGNAVMVQGGNYRVDPKFAGQQGNNWVTRAVGSVNTSIEKLISQSLKAAL